MASQLISTIILELRIVIPQPLVQVLGLASFLFARRYLGNRFIFLFLALLRCFSSGGSLLYTYVFSIG